MLVDVTVVVDSMVDFGMLRQLQAEEMIAPTVYDPKHDGLGEAPRFFFDVAGSPHTGVTVTVRVVVPVILLAVSVSVLFRIIVS